MNSCHVIVILSLFAIDPALLRVHSNGNDVQLRGEGDFFPLEVFDTWIAAYRSIRERFQSLYMVYSIQEARSDRDLLRVIGNSTHGIEYTAVTGSSDQIKNIDHKKYPDLRILPVIAGAVVVGYHIRKVNKIYPWSIWSVYITGP